MATVVEQFVALLGWDVPASEQAKLAKYEKSMDGIIGGFTKVAKVAAAAGAALFTAMTVVNQATTENLRLARSLGVSIEEFEAWGDVLDDIGIKGDAVAKMMLDFQKNIGELKISGLKSMEDALTGVGLRLEDIQDLAPNEQLLAFLDAAKGVEDVQVAIGAASKLLGRQGKFIIPYLRTLDGSMTDILAKSIRIIQLTEEGAEGAEAWAREMDTMKTAMGSWGKQILGLLGGALAPYLERLTDWIAANKELIQQKTREWVDRIRRAVLFLAPKIGWVVRKIGDLITAVDDLAQGLGGWHNVMKLLGAYLTGAILTKGVLIIMKIAAAWKAAGAAALIAQVKMLLIPAAIAALILIFEDFYRFLVGDKSVIGGLLKTAGVSEETVQAIRDSWLQFGEWIEGWSGGVGATLSAFWKEIGDGFDMFVVQPIKNGVNDIIAAVKKIPFVETIMGTTTEGSTAGGREAAYGFGKRMQGNVLTGAGTGVRGSGGGGSTTITAPITINAKTDMNEKQIARAVEKGIGGVMAQAKRANSTGVDY